MIYNVTPTDDLIDHDEDDDCPCGPDTELVPGCVIYVHHSLDGREKTE